ncbi:resolvase [Burkholderia pseudomallei]|uniref:Recombinase family protein n=1 Tax=Paraburkholderia sejongensis TaxID=2886946 RepID=A0ABS8JWN2_9BURK|nr:MULTISPECIES: recombinase family protein [Burkholderiaceae]MCC8394233.1 recombinase family protein [Paraburkholderia sp. MMS20-SJTR3]ONB63072.1 resolvase [Burkholderia pseudomallei]ONC00299.1 resolvase [Burkholderia pseudomallei]
MAQGKFVAYYRVSTARQGASGLGLDAQREAVARYLNGGEWELVGEFTETETGKGANALEKRPQLRAALELCKRRGATLIIAKLDRLARNVHFVSGLLETGCDFVAADMPQANKVMIQMHAVMAEWERDQISKRTKDALAAAKARGVKLGTAGAANLKPNVEARQRAADAFAVKLAGMVAGFRARNLSQRDMVAELNALGIKTPNGGTWHRGQLCRLLERIDSA